MATILETRSQFQSQSTDPLATYREECSGWALRLVVCWVLRSVLTTGWKPIPPIASPILALFVAQVYANSPMEALEYLSLLFKRGWEQVHDNLARQRSSREEKENSCRNGGRDSDAKRADSGYTVGGLYERSETTARFLVQLFCLLQSHP